MIVIRWCLILRIRLLLFLLKKSKVPLLGSNVTVTGEGLSYLEKQKIAKREKAIYDEMNKHTKDAPFTILFTGHIPDDIQEKRLRMMSEIGVFGDQLNKLEKPQDASNSQNLIPDTGVLRNKA